MSIQIGFPSPRDYAAVTVEVRLEGLCPGGLGYDRFRRLFHACIAAAKTLAPGVYIAEAIHERGARTGYLFRFPDALTAMRFRLCHLAALWGQPSPLRGPYPTSTARGISVDSGSTR